MRTDGPNFLSAVAGQRVYTANANYDVTAWTLPDGSVTYAGMWSALDAATGEVLWSFVSGGSCLSGAAISNGEVYWGSGYGNFGFGTPNNKLYAFTLP